MSYWFDFSMLIFHQRSSPSTYIHSLTWVRYISLHSRSRLILWRGSEKDRNAIFFCIENHITFGFGPSISFWGFIPYNKIIWVKQTLNTCDWLSRPHWCIYCIENSSWQLLGADLFEVAVFFNCFPIWPYRIFDQWMLRSNLIFQIVFQFLMISKANSPSKPNRKQM